MAPEPAVHCHDLLLDQKCAQGIAQGRRTAAHHAGLIIGGGYTASRRPHRALRGPCGAYATERQGHRLRRPERRTEMTPSSGLS